MIYFLATQAFTELLNLLVPTLPQGECALKGWTLLNFGAICLGCTFLVLQPVCSLHLED